MLTRMARMVITTILTRMARMIITTRLTRMARMIITILERSENLKFSSFELSAICIHETYHIFNLLFIIFDVFLYVSQISYIKWIIVPSKSQIFKGDTAKKWIERLVLFLVSSFGSITS